MIETNRTFIIQSSPKCYRFKEEAFYNHAPQEPGVYELVTFDANGEAIVLFVGLAETESVFAALMRHHRNQLLPHAHDLLAQYPNLYFDFVFSDQVKSLHDLRLIQAWLIRKNKPTFNAEFNEPFPENVEFVEDNDPLPPSCRNSHA